jgi:hypothetical protein
MHPEAAHWMSWEFARNVAPGDVHVWPLQQFVTHVVWTSQQPAVVQTLLLQIIDDALAFAM